MDYVLASSVDWGSWSQRDGQKLVGVTYVHVSDIHFGQEKGSEVYVHDDVKECLLADAAALREENGLGKMDGVIVTGDIAFSGNSKQYMQAGRWLDLLTEAIGCEKTDVMVVPGNHDVDRVRVSAGGRLMLDRIIAGGDGELDGFLADERDREVLYARFEDYRDFSEGYGCRLEADGGVAIDRRREIAPGRYLRFIGLNSALVCSRDGEEGSLLIGGKQRVLPRTVGEEVVVLCHHPVESLQDAEEAARYIQSRARVHVYGHVHRASWQVEEPVDGADLLTLSAGAVVPPKAEVGYGYTYNVMTFEWDAGNEGLSVVITPRSWNKEATRFEADAKVFGEEEIELVLRCPNFARAAAVEATRRATHQGVTPAGERERRVREGDVRGGRGMAKGSRLLRLHFFRDLTAGQRLWVLKEVGILPRSWAIELTHTVERRLLDGALDSGKYEELKTAMVAARGERNTAGRAAKT